MCGDAIDSTAGSIFSPMTRAPRAASISVIARPIPLAAPVTMATLPLTSFIFCMSVSIPVMALFGEAPALSDQMKTAFAWSPAASRQQPPAFDTAAAIAGVLISAMGA